jgi:CHAT domain-containing protein
MVVLSACETGLGETVPGEGLIGMTRGLMYAGALRVNVSLWKVDDKATAELMQDMYTQLWRTRQSHAASLRTAQLNLWQQGKHPYFWAAFTLQGEWRN